MDIIKELNQSDSLNELVNTWSLSGLHDADLRHCGDRLWLRLPNWKTRLYFCPQWVQLKQMINVQLIHIEFIDVMTPSLFSVKWKIDILTGDHDGDHEH